MDLVTKYIMTHSTGSKRPIGGSEIARAFSVSGVEVRRLINAARSNGDPICSNGKGYYIAKDKEELRHTIESMRGRIKAMSEAVDGMEKCLRGA